MHRNRLSRHRSWSARRLGQLSMEQHHLSRHQLGLSRQRNRPSRHRTGRAMHQNRLSRHRSWIAMHRSRLSRHQLGLSRHQLGLSRQGNRPSRLRTGRAMHRSRLSRHRSLSAIRLGQLSMGGLLGFHQSGRKLEQIKVSLYDEVNVLQNREVSCCHFRISYIPSESHFFNELSMTRRRPIDLFFIDEIVCRHFFYTLLLKTPFNIQSIIFHVKERITFYFYINAPVLYNRLQSRAFERNCVVPIKPFS